MKEYNTKIKIVLLLGFGLICLSTLSISVCASNLISEDKIWEYFNCEGQPEASRRFTRYKFSGTETINNLTYHRLVRIYESRILIKGTPETGWENIMVENFDEVCVALMREDEDRVYLLLDPQSIYVKYDKAIPSDPYWEELDYFMKYNPNSALHGYHDPGKGINGLTGVEEMVLYDFSELESEYISNTKVLKYGCVRNDEAFLNVVGKTLHISTGMIDIKGKTYKTYTVIPEYLRDVLETITWWSFHLEDFQLIYTHEFGNIGRGTLYELTNERPFDISSSMWGEEEVRLNRVLDLEGNILYSTPQTIDPSAIHEINREFNQDQRIYDLMGREIRDPQLGTIYIHGGKKYVAQ